ncbi:MAG TPA: AMP-binding protein [Gemmatimonas sp.]|nr:AMP-binding protein [Gemmatimonas sp.]
MKIISSPFPSPAVPDVALTPFVLRHAESLAEKTAIVCGLTGQQYSYGELAVAIKRTAAGLHARGIRKGDVVGMVSPNLPDFAVAFFAINSLGAIPSTVNPIATAEEIGTQFADSEAVLVFTMPQLLEKCQTAARMASTVREIITFRATGNVADGLTPFAELQRFGDVPPIVEIDAARDIAVLPYSSGTSGIPKGVMLSHRNIVANLVQTQGDTPMLTSDDRVIAVLPFFHIYGMTVILAGALAQGASIVTLPRFDLEQFLRTMQDHRVTYANVVPPIVLALAKHPLVDDFDLSALRTVFSGAAPLGNDLATACARRLNVQIRQGYGLTETSPVTNVHPLDSGSDELESVGPLLAGTEARVVDMATGDDAQQGDPGELWVRGPQVMMGYFNKPEATAACTTPDGWFKTGDVAIVDARGWFRIVDRVKELIKYKGLQVAPAELEAVLLSHPGIADAAVIPVQDEVAGEIPKAYVVLRAPLTEADVMAYVAERVSPYKKVRRVEFIDAVPKSPSGKILRRMLVQRERERTMTVEGA